MPPDQPSILKEYIHLRNSLVSPIAQQKSRSRSYEYVEPTGVGPAYIDVVFDFNHDLEEFGAESFDIETDNIRTEFDNYFEIESITKDEVEEGKYTVRVEVLQADTDEELKIDRVWVREEGTEYSEEFDPEYFRDEGIDTEYVFDSDGVSMLGLSVGFEKVENHAGETLDIIDVTYVLDGALSHDTLSADDFLATKHGVQGDAKTPSLATYLEQPCEHLTL